MEIQATSDSMYWSGTGSGFPEVTARVYSVDVLPQEVAHDDSKEFSWEVRAEGTSAFYDIGDIGVPFWVTWDDPGGSSETPRRLNFATDSADGAASEEAIADGIHNALGNVDPPFEPGEREDMGAGWVLLDGFTYGQCHHQAYLMELAVRILGVPGQLESVRASDPDGESPYDCLDEEYRWCPIHGGGEFLCLDFYGGGTPENMNALEGCCVAADHYYAVWPKEKATSDLDMLRELGQSGVTQRWCWWDRDLTPPWWHPCNGPDNAPEIP